MLPYLLGADLSSGCAILRVLHKEILASTAEHTVALHERFAKPISCRDKTKLLLTLRQWLTDLKELQAAGSSTSKETVMQSSAGAAKGAKGDHNGAHSATIPCKHFAKGTCDRGDKCRFTLKSLDSKPCGRGNKGKKSNSDRDRRKKCVEKSRIRHIGQNRVQRILPLLRKLC